MSAGALLSPRRAASAERSSGAAPESGRGAIKGIAFLVASTGFFACSDVIAKALTATLPPVEVAWLRYVTFALILIPAVMVSGGTGALRTHRLGLQLFRGLGTVGSALLFTAGLTVLPVAESTTIYFVSPILIMALSIPLLGEAVDWRRWSAALIGLAGVVVVIRPGTSAFEVASLLPLAGAMSWAVAAVVTRKMSGADRPLTTMVYSAAVGLAVTTLLLPFHFVVPSARDIGLGLALGAFSTAGHYLVVLAYRQASASLVAPYGYAQLIWVGALGYLVFGSLPDAYTIGGAAIIAASGLYTALGERARAGRG